VAKLAGVPAEVQERAQEILAHLEENSIGPNDEPRFAPQHRPDEPRPRAVQMPLFKPLDARVRKDLLALEPEAMTPLDALSALTEIVRRLRDEEKP
jgi:DNA mismatch repair protein MutS